ncbi:hypothetical protein [Desulfosarcina ovata]|uniref:HTH cro/C1-type domain-containing protein n=1 Tax=Desulfosarcina ovata subsp. ovata TaxID=2752305 RepID=A0A5K8AC75_9BACT|nr:hypothetical protein [Desulfosarcina ovata]BBO90323.1 hypothetical protein DSCOOX_35030 [Desulfosarcina ovata subsp. ovata]
MKIEEVPQDQGMITDGRREVCYAVDDQGRYVLAGSAGWEPKNIANRQAWDRIDQTVAATLDRIRAGKASPLAYYMALNQMDVGLLAKYAGIGRLKVWLHLKPGPFGRLSPAVLKRYADVFDISADTLKSVPEDRGDGSRDR